MGCLPEVGLEATSHPCLADSPKTRVIVLEGVQNYHHGNLEAESRQKVVLYSGSQILINSRWRRKSDQSAATRHQMLHTLLGRCGTPEMSLFELGWTRHELASWQLPMPKSN